MRARAASMLRGVDEVLVLPVVHAEGEGVVVVEDVDAEEEEEGREEHAHAEVPVQGAGLGVPRVLHQEWSLKAGCPPGI